MNDTDVAGGTDADDIVEGRFTDRLPTRAPGWWCWRCGWWQAEAPGRYRPSACPECARWSQERQLSADTVRPVLVTLEVTR